MLIPQAWVGIADRRRPDFVIFVPVQHWKYTKLAIQLDGAHPETMAPVDEMRNMEIAMHGYEVRKIRPETSNYFEEARCLVEDIERMMQFAEASPVDKDGPVLALADENDKGRATLTLNDGEPTLSLRDENGKARIALSTTKSGTELYLLDENDKT